MVRGIERRGIVDDAKDRRGLIARLGDAARLLGVTTSAVAKCLMRAQSTLSAWSRMSQLLTFSRELGMSNTEVGTILGVSQPAVGYAVRRGGATDVPFFIDSSSGSLLARC